MYFSCGINAGAPWLSGVSVKRWLIIPAELLGAYGVIGLRAPRRDACMDWVCVGNLSATDNPGN